MPPNGKKVYVASSATNQYTGQKDRGMLALLDAKNPPRLAETITADDIMNADQAATKKQPMRPAQLYLPSLRVEQKHRRRPPI
jgi:hypothetical protein